MSGRNPFTNNPARSKQGRELRCEEWEALLADALDGLLSASDTAAFDVHSAQCEGCADLLAHAKAGREWLTYLHAEPVVPSDMVAKILDRTAGTASIPVELSGGLQPAATHALQIPFRKTFYETRLLMTAAMAFFSIALTLNLAGVKLTSLKLADLKPSTMGNNLSHQIYGAKGQMVRYYDSLRFVYLMESKMRELRRDAEADQQPAQPKDDQNTNTNTNKQNNTNKTGGKLEVPHSSSPSSGHSPVLWGQKQLAKYSKPGKVTTSNTKRETEEVKAGPLVIFKDDQAERSLA